MGLLQEWDYNAKVLCEEMRTAVSSGTSTLFWDHSWAFSKPLCTVVTQPIPESIAGATVAEMWDTSQGWKWEIFAPFLHQEHLKLIESYELQEDPEVADLVYWQGGLKGRFSIKSAIRIMRNENDAIDDECWDIIWKSPVQQRIRAFLWIVCHDRLMGNLNRFKRKLIDDPRCIICDAQEESTMHILRDCPAAKLVWRRVGGPSNSPHFFHKTLKEWVSENLIMEKVDEDPVWSTYFGVTLWWIWRFRNSMVFSRQQDLPVDIGAFLQIRYEENRRAIERSSELLYPTTRQKEEVFVRWSHPAQDWYALNVDGAAKGSPGAAGGGAIIRNHMGQFISALSANFGHCTSFKAEVTALVKGLELAKNMQIEKLVVQMDNFACVQVLRSKNWGRNECSHLFEYVMKLIECPSWMVKIVHVYREGNRAADWLANQGVTQHIILQIFSSVPADLNRIIMEDAMGVTTPRIVPL